MTETPRDFTVKVFSIKGARQTDKMHMVRICVKESSHRLTCPGNGLDKKIRELNGGPLPLTKLSPVH